MTDAEATVHSLLLVAHFTRTVTESPIPDRKLIGREHPKLPAGKHHELYRNRIGRAAVGVRRKPTNGRLVRRDGCLFEPHMLCVLGEYKLAVIPHGDNDGICVPPGSEVRVGSVGWRYHRQGQGDRQPNAGLHTMPPRPADTEISGEAPFGAVLRPLHLLCSTALLGPQPRRSARAAANSLGRSRSPKRDCPYCPSTEQ